MKMDRLYSNGIGPVGTTKLARFLGTKATYLELVSGISAEVGYQDGEKAFE